MMTMLEASFSIWSKNLTLEEISKISGVAPDGTSVRGVDRNPPRGLPLANGWHLILKQENEIFIENILRALIGRINSFYHKINTLRTNDPDIILRISLMLSPSPSDFSLYIPNDLLDSMAKIGADMDIVFEDVDRSDT